MYELERNGTPGLKQQNEEHYLLLLPTWPLTDGALTFVKKQQYFAKKGDKTAQEVREV